MKVKVISPDPNQAAHADDRQVIENPLGLPDKEFKALAESVFIAVPHRPSAGISAPLAQNFGWWARNGTPVATMADEFGGFVEITRANIVRTFLNFCDDYPAVKYMVLIDADEAVPVDAPYRLAFWNKDVVGGVVCSYNGARGAWANFTVKDKYGVGRFPSVRYTKSMPARGLIKVESVGTGLLCVKKNVFEVIKNGGDQPFMIPENIRLESCELGTLKYGEDISFSRQCEKHGFDRHVDLSIHATHYKTIAIGWPQAMIDSELEPDDWEVAVEDYHHA